VLSTEKQLKHREKRYKYLLCYWQERISLDLEYIRYAIQAYSNKHNHKNMMFQHEWACIQVIHCRRFYENSTRWVYDVYLYHDQCCWRIDYWTLSESNE